MKLNKVFRENHHDHRGITDRIDYIFAQKVSDSKRTYPPGTLFFSIKKADGGGWTFLGRHFNSIQGAKKEARKYCNQRADAFS